MPMIFDTRELGAILGEISRDDAREVAGRWHSESQEILFEAGDELEWDVKNVARLSLPPQWEDDAWTFSYSHEAARYINDGTAPHEIRPVNAESLVFEWEDAPRKVREMFEETFPTVFLPKTNHPGTPPVRFMERGRDRAVDGFGGAGGTGGGGP